MSKENAQHRINEQLEYYWYSLRGERSIPLESDIDMAQLSGIWDYCFLVSVHADRFAYSYFGKALVEAYGDDITGHEITETLLYPHPHSLIKTFEQVRDSATPHTDDSEFTNVHGRKVKYRSCVMPLGSHGAEGVTFLLGGMKWKAY